MYGGHLAINHLVVHERLDVQIAHNLLDQSVRNAKQDGMHRHARLHLHCWHGHLPFSKFDFKKNQYDHIDPSSLLNDTSARAYVNTLPLPARKIAREISLFLGDADGIGIQTDDPRRTRSTVEEQSEVVSLVQSSLFARTVVVREDLSARHSFVTVCVETIVQNSILIFL